ncbi:MAG: hypothetical protein AAF985_00235 [Bacteroidota bacterium]
MDFNQIKEGLLSIAPKGYQIKDYPGGFMLQQKAKLLTYNIGINYLDYSPKYLFTAMTAGIYFEQVQQILDPLLGEHLQIRNENQFNSTLAQSFAFSKQMMRKGIYSTEDLTTLLVEAKVKMDQDIDQWFSAHHNLEEVVEKVKNWSFKKRAASLGKVHADMKMLILFWITGDHLAYQIFKAQALQKYEGAVQKTPQLQKYLNLIQAIIDHLEKQEI